MQTRPRPRLSYANVVATLALFVALGGAATAATSLPRNSVGPKQLRNGAVTAKDLRKNAVRRNKIAPKAVTVGKIGPQAVLPGNIVNGGVKTNKLANQAVNASKIRNNTVTTAKLNNNAVTNQKLAPEAVGAGNLQSGSVTVGKLASDTAPLLGTLKSGQTLRGVFSVGASSGAEGGPAYAAFGYQFPLLAAPTATVLQPGQTTAACGGLSGGNEQTPLAAPGNLCVYVTETENIDFESSPLTVDYNVRLGFVLKAVEGGKKAGPFFSYGQWAVTAP